jgi:hypothetical protein
MTFPVDDILLGPASFGGLHRLDMLIGHTGEEPGFSRDYAVKTTIWQRTNPGSYNFRIYNAASAGSRGGVLLTVPYLVASGGINPSSAYWAPGRFPFLERELARAGPCPVRGCAGPYRNPTMHAGQISFTGRTADLATKAPANYVRDAERLIAWYDGLAIRGPAPLVLVMHGHWQRNRSDWGAWMHAQLTEEDDMPLTDWRPVEEDWTTRIGPDAGAFWTGGPDQGEKKHFTTATAVHTTAESKDGAWRLGVAAGIAEILCFPRGSLANPRNRRPAAPAYGYQAPPSVADLTAKVEDLGETVTRLSGRIKLKDEHIGKYPKG